MRVLMGDRGRVAWRLLEGRFRRFPSFFFFIYLFIFKKTAFYVIFNLAETFIGRKIYFCGLCQDDRKETVEEHVFY